MIFLLVLSCYLLGSIPTAFIAGKLLKGIDIREHGSGNVGATNALRVLGKSAGAVVLLIDVIKGFVSVAIIPEYIKIDNIILLRVIAALAVVIGHNWTIFLNFKGGKGIATSLGVLIALAVKIIALRIVLFFTLLTWFVFFLPTGFVSLASLSAAIMLPIYMLITRQAFPIIALGTVFCVFIVFRHKSNIKNLLSGQEKRINLPFLKKSNK